MAGTQKRAAREAAPEPLRYDVRIHAVYQEGSCRAIASANINGSFAVRGIKVMEGANGLFAAMPSYKTGNGEYKDICFPCTKEARARMNEAVLNAYYQHLSQGQGVQGQKGQLEGPSGMGM